jgi:hypothetical protein
VNGIHGVRGSIPLISTTFFEVVQFGRPRFILGGLPSMMMLHRPHLRRDICLQNVADVGHDRGDLTI